MRYTCRDIYQYVAKSVLNRLVDERFKPVELGPVRGRSGEAGDILGHAGGPRQASRWTALVTLKLVQVPAGRTGWSRVFRAALTLPNKKCPSHRPTGGFGSSSPSAAPCANGRHFAKETVGFDIDFASTAPRFSDQNNRKPLGSLAEIHSRMPCRRLQSGEASRMLRQRCDTGFQSLLFGPQTFEITRESIIVDVGLPQAFEIGRNGLGNGYPAGSLSPGKGNRSRANSTLSTSPQTARRS